MTWRICSSRPCEIHPYNVLVRNLRSQIIGAVQRDCTTAEMLQQLATYLDRRIELSRVVAEAASHYIDEQDTLVLYGFSHNVIRLVKEYLPSHVGDILVVECCTGLGREHDLSQRVLQALMPQSQRCAYVRLESLPGVFDYEKGSGRRVKVLLGTLGVLQDGTILAIAGSRMVCSAARSSEFEVCVLAESDKLSSDSGFGQQIGRLTRTLVSEEKDSIHESNPPREVYSVIDAIRRELYTRLIVDSSRSSPSSSLSC